MAQTVKNLPAMWEIQVQSLGWEDPLEKEMATHFSILPWRIHGQRTLVGYSPWGHKESVTHIYIPHICIYICMHTHIYISHGIQRNEVLMYATKWMNLENIMPSERSQTKEASCMISFHECSE